MPPQMQPPAVRKRWLVQLARVVRLVQLVPPELLEGFSGLADSEAERSRPVRLRTNRQEPPRRAAQKKRTKALSVRTARSAVFLENPLFRQAHGAGPQTSPALQNPSGRNLKAAPAAAGAEDPADLAEEADLAAAPDAKFSATPAEQAECLAVSAGAALMCMSMMISTTVWLAWAGTSPLQTPRSKAHPPAAPEAAGSPIPYPPQIQRLEEAAGAGEGLPLGNPANREAAPSSRLKPALPGGNQRRPDRGRAVQT